MINKAVITPTESDVYLAEYADWIALDDTAKTAHIVKGSTYAQIQWECVDVDWADTPNIPDNIKEAVAYYSYADSKGALYGDSGTADAGGELKVDLVTVGSVTVSKEFFGGTSDKYSASSQLGYPNSLMKLDCVRNSASNGLVRN